jgi:hypothetical protein
MTDQEIDALARELLTRAVKEVRAWDSDYFYSVDEVTDGNWIVTFAATGPTRTGQFRL